MKRVALTVAAVIMIGLVALAVGAAERPDGDTPLPDGKFRVTSEDVFRNHDTVVVRLTIDARPGAFVRMTSDRARKGSLGTAVPVDPTPDEPVRLIILADHVRWDAGGVDAVKFLARLGGTTGSATMSDTGPLPEGKTRLADLFSVTARSGYYAEGVSIPVAAYQGTTYSLLVEPPGR